MRYLVFFVLVYSLLVPDAFAQNRQRVAISDVVENFDFKSRPDILGNCTVPGATAGSSGCKVHKYLYCASGQCTTRTTSGATANPNISTTFHPWASAASALEGTTNVDVIMLTGPDIQAKINWVASNAMAERIASFVLVHDANSSTFTSAQYSAFNNTHKVTIINSTGNNGLNGFNPQTSGFGMNGLAARSDTIAVGSGFKPGPGPCDILPFEQRVSIQLMCTSNAPEASNGPENFYVEFGCAPGYSYSEGKACGTSFAAPRVAGIIAEMRNLNPNLTFTQVRSALSSSTGMSALGAYLNSNDQIHYQRVDLDGALSGVPIVALEPRLTYSISNLQKIVPIAGCDPVVNWKWGCVTLQLQPLTLTIEDASKIEGVIVNRNWSVSPTMSFQEQNGSKAISMVIGPVKGTSYISQKPSSVTLQITDSNNNIGTTTIPITYPVLSDTPNFGPGCILTFDDTGTITSDVCTRILFAGNGGDIETLPSPMLLFEEFLYCTGSSAQHILQAFTKGTIRQYDFQYKIGNGGWTSVGVTRQKSRSVSFPSNSSVTMRVRHLSASGWSNYQTHIFSAESCNNGGGGFGGGYFGPN